MDITEHVQRYCRVREELPRYTLYDCGCSFPTTEGKEHGVRMFLCQYHEGLDEGWDDGANEIRRLRALIKEAVEASDAFDYMNGTDAEWYRHAEAQRLLREEANR